MISYKVLIILFVIFAMSYCWPDTEEHNLSEREKKPDMLECMNTLLTIGFYKNIGFLNYSLVMQFSDFNEYRKHVVRSIRSNLCHVIISLETGYLKAFYDKIRETECPIKLEKPGEFCERQNTYFLHRKAEAEKKKKNGLSHYLDIFKKSETFSVEKCTTNITDYKLRHNIVDDSHYTETQYVIKTKYSAKDDKIVEMYDENNPYRNVRTSYKLTFLRYPETGDFVDLKMSGYAQRYFNYHVNFIMDYVKVMPELIPYHLCKSYLKIETENSDVNKGLPITTLPSDF